MDVSIDTIQRPQFLQDLICWGGYAILAAIVFAETGLLIGFFLPGDSLLFAAGIGAARGWGGLEIGPLILFLSIAAVAGNATGYWFGRKVGARLYERPDSRFFKKRHLIKAQEFYEKHGGITVVLARFIPVVRTFATIVAGAANMPYGRFLFYNVVGGIGWVVSMCLLGYTLGTRVKNIDHYTLPVIGGIILLSVVPPILHVLKGRAAVRVAAPDAVETAELVER